MKHTMKQTLALLIALLLTLSTFAFSEGNVELAHFDENEATYSQELGFNGHGDLTVDNDTVEVDEVSLYDLSLNALIDSPEDVTVLPSSESEAEEDIDMNETSEALEFIPEAEAVEHIVPEMEEQWLVGGSIEDGEGIDSMSEVDLFAAGNVAIDTSNFPDEVFRNYVSRLFDYDEDGFLSSAERGSIRYLYASGQAIYSLKGIEYFYNLNYLDCSYTDITNLDTSQNTSLETLACFNNNSVISLDLSHNTSLKYLVCYGCQLTKLDLGNCTSLTQLVCNNNKLTNLDLSSCTALESLVCTKNNIQTIDVSNCAYLIAAAKRTPIVDDDGSISLGGLYIDNFTTIIANGKVLYGEKDPTLEELTFPIIIESNHGTKAAFYESLEQIVLDTKTKEYNRKLAYMLMSLAAAAYNDTGKQKGELTIENAGYRSSSKELKYITKAYEDLGFRDYKPYHYYNNPNDSAYGKDNVAFTIGLKQISKSEALVLIVIRGSYGDISSSTSDWQSNVLIYTEENGRHLGFGRAADKVYSALKSFLNERNYSDKAIKSNIRYVITGHSRGAAVSNLLAVKLHDVGIPSSKVYSYNFACPDTVRSDRFSSLNIKYKNIFNICNSADAISLIPGILGDGYYTIRERFKDQFLHWNKYGTTRFYCKDWKSKTEFDLARTFNKKSTHDYKYYVTDMGNNSYGLYTRNKTSLRRTILFSKGPVKKMVKKIIKKLFSGYAL